MRKKWKKKKKVKDTYYKLRIMHHKLWTTHHKLGTTPQAPRKAAYHVPSIFFEKMRDKKKKEKMLPQVVKKDFG